MAEDSFPLKSIDCNHCCLPLAAATTNPIIFVFLSVLCNRFWGLDAYLIKEWLYHTIMSDQPQNVCFLFSVEEYKAEVDLGCLHYSRREYLLFMEQLLLICLHTFVLCSEAATI